MLSFYATTGMWVSVWQFIYVLIFHRQNMYWLFLLQEFYFSHCNINVHYALPFFSPWEGTECIYAGTTL